MREIYVILGWVGWIWLGVWLGLVGLGLLVQYSRRGRDGVRGFEVTVRDEKQS